MSTTRSAALALACCMSLASTAQAAVHTAGTGPGCDYPTVQAAVDAAEWGDEIQLRAETFSEIVTADRDLAIHGGFSECGDASALLFNKTTIEAPTDSNAPVVSLAGGATVELVRLILTGAVHDGQGGGLLVGNDTTAAIELVELAHNEASQGGGAYVGQRASLRTAGGIGASVYGNSASAGGGIYVRNGGRLDFVSAAASAVYIEENTAGNGAGLYAGGTATVLIGRTHFERNAASSAGGGLYGGPATDQGTILVDESTFTANSAANGAGIRVSGNVSASKALEIRASTLAGNVASDSGGALYASGAELEVEITDTLWQDNQAGGSGGAIYAGSAAVHVIGSAFVDNAAATDGGALLVSGGSIAMHGFTSQTLLQGNSAGARGGAMRLQNATIALGGTSLDDFGVLVVDNVADQGGAVYVAGSNAELVLGWPLQFLRNAAGADGGALYAGDGAHVRTDGQGAPFARILLDGNRAGEAGPGFGGGIYLDEAELQAAWMQIGSPSGPGPDAGNHASSDGGGLMASAGSQATLYNSHVLGNSAAGVAGGIGVDELSTVHVTALMDGHGGPVPPMAVSACEPALLAANAYCSAIDGNSATSGGGAVNKGQLDIVQSAVRDNAGGGVVNVPQGETVLRNVLLSGHPDLAVHVATDSTLVLDHATVVDNGTRTLHMEDTAAASLQVQRSIVWDNDQALVVGDGQLSSSCNVTQDGQLAGVVADPLLGTSDRGGHRLREGSVALDLCFEGAEAFDLDGAMRPQGARFDAGAFEGVAVIDALFVDGFEDE